MMITLCAALVTSQALGGVRPLPMLGQSGFGLDDMQAMPEIAIVQPIGKPFSETRTQKWAMEKGPTEITVVVQRFHVLAASPALPDTVDVVDAAWTQYPQSAQYPQIPSLAIQPLEGQRYLLFAEPAHEGYLPMSKHMFGRDGRLPQLMHYVAAKKTSEVVGWALARTSATTIPTVRPRAEQVLKCLVEACGMAGYDREFDGAKVLAKLSRYSWRTAEKANQQDIAKSTTEDFVAPRITSDQFYNDNVIPRLKAIAEKAKAPTKTSIYSLLASWNDPEGIEQARLNHIKP